MKNFYSLYTNRLLFIICISGGLLSLHFSCKKQNTVPGNTLSLTTEKDLPSVCNELLLTARQDLQGRNFLYVAAKEAGLKIISLGDNPMLIKTVPVTDLDNLQVMNLSQSGNFLYLALGNHFGTAHQNPGMAILDVSNPANPVIKSTWKDPSKLGGAGIVETSGNFAYLGAMKNGLIIFDITDKSLPVLQSAVVPVISYPDANPDPAKYNARGLAVQDNKVYLCYDAGGLRIFDVSDKSNPVETGRFSNPVMNNKPRAYNNIVLDGHFAYVTVDYCGLEILDISNPAAVQLISWWNPWNCQTNPFNWFSSNGHTNEIAMDKTNKLVFMSSGKSDMQVVGVSDPFNPQFRFEYGGTANNIGTWGVSVHANKIYLTYICNPLGIPFASNWTGVKIIRYEIK